MEKMENYQSESRLMQTNLEQAISAKPWEMVMYLFQACSCEHSV